MKVKHAVSSRKRKKKVLKAAKGYWGERSTSFRRATETVRRAKSFAYAHRRLKKREFNSLWITRIGAASQERGFSYRGIMHALKENKIILSKDILAKIAAEYPQIFDKICETVKK